MLIYSSIVPKTMIWKNMKKYWVYELITFLTFSHITILMYHINNENRKYPC